MGGTTFQPDLLTGKVAFVAGASSGINLAIAETLGRHGARLALISRNADKIAAAAGGLAAMNIECIGQAADVRDFAAVDAAMQAAVARFGAIDIVISGAAGNFVAAARDMSANGFKTVVDIDLIGSFNVLRASYPHLRKPGATLISITAPQAVRPTVMQAHVCAAKAGINMLTKVLALEWGPEGIRVNAISPGPIAGTEGMARLAPNAEAEAAVKWAIALRRYGEKSEIADAALYLCSDSARYVTGTVLDCDGGAGLAISALG